MVWMGSFGQRVVVTMSEILLVTYIASKPKEVEEWIIRSETFGCAALEIKQWLWIE